MRQIGLPASLKGGTTPQNSQHHGNMTMDDDDEAEWPFHHQLGPPCCCLAEPGQFSGRVLKCGTHGHTHTALFRGVLALSLAGVLQGDAGREFDRFLIALIKNEF